MYPRVPRLRHVASAEGPVYQRDYLSRPDMRSRCSNFSLISCPWRGRGHAGGGGNSVAATAGTSKSSHRHHVSRLDEIARRLWSRLRFGFASVVFVPHLGDRAFLCLPAAPPFVPRATGSGDNDVCRASLPPCNTRARLVLAVGAPVRVATSAVTFSEGDYDFSPANVGDSIDPPCPVWMPPPPGRSGARARRCADDRGRSLIELMNRMTEKLMVPLGTLVSSLVTRRWLETDPGMSDGTPVLTRSPFVAHLLGLTVFGMDLFLCR